MSAAPGVQAEVFDSVCDTGERGSDGQATHWCTAVISDLKRERFVNAEDNSKEALVRFLYDKHREELCRYLVDKYQLHPSEAEDAVQTAFMRFSELDDSTSVKNPRAFLYKSCRNIVIDRMRRNAVRDKYAKAVETQDHSLALAAGPERTVDSRQRLGLIAKALWAMPSKRRRLLMMSRFDGLSYAEISRQVGLSETVVRKHISKALADCRKALQ